MRSTIVVTTLAFAQICAAEEMHIGIGTHAGQNTQTSNEIAIGLRALGNLGFRDEPYWDKTETYPNNLNTETLPKPLTQLYNNLSDEVLSVSIFSLGYGHPHYDNGGRPKTQYALQGYSRYANYIAKRFPKIGHLEIWNEWNLPTGKNIKDKGSADEYTKLAKETIPSIRETKYPGKVLVGGVGGDWPDWNHSKVLAQNKLLSIADGYSVHLYNFSKSSDPREMISRLDRLNSIFKEAGYENYPIYVTEVGWPTTNRHVLGVQEIQQTEKLAAFILLASTRPWIKGVWIYELFDNTLPQSEIEKSFGIFKTISSPKAGFCTLRAAVRLVKQATLIAHGKSKLGFDWLIHSEGENQRLTLIGAGQNIEAPPDWSTSFSDMCNTHQEKIANKNGPDTNEKTLLTALIKNETMEIIRKSLEK